MDRLQTINNALRQKDTDDGTFFCVECGITKPLALLSEYEPDTCNPCADGQDTAE